MRIRVDKLSVRTRFHATRRTAAHTVTQRAHVPCTADGAPGAALSPRPHFLPTDEELRHLQIDLQAQHKG